MAKSRKAITLLGLARQLVDTNLLIVVDACFPSRLYLGQGGGSCSIEMQYCERPSADFLRYRSADGIHVQHLSVDSRKFDFASVLLLVSDSLCKKPSFPDSVFNLKETVRVLSLAASRQSRIPDGDPTLAP